jgi:hypothetical protein
MQTIGPQAYHRLPTKVHATSERAERGVCLEWVKPQPSGVVLQLQGGELGEQIAVGPILILRHLPVGEESREGIDGVANGCPPTVRKGEEGIGGDPRRTRQP